MRNGNIHNSSTTIPGFFKHKGLRCYKAPNRFLYVHKKYKSGYKLGEFFFTRKPYYYPQKERGKKKR
jgi:ribosomal protein S19